MTNSIKYMVRCNNKEPINITIRKQVFCLSTPPFHLHFSFIKTCTCWLTSGSMRVALRSHKMESNGNLVREKLCSQYHVTGINTELDHRLYKLGILHILLMQGMRSFFLSDRKCVFNIWDDLRSLASSIVLSISVKSWF